MGSVTRTQKTAVRRGRDEDARSGLVPVTEPAVRPLQIVAVIEIASERIDRQPAISQKPNARRAQSKEVPPPFGTLGDAERDARKTLPIL